MTHTLTRQQKRYLAFLFVLTSAVVLTCAFIDMRYELPKQWDDQNMYDETPPPPGTKPTEGQDLFYKAYPTYVASAASLESSLALLVVLSLFCLMLATQTDLSKSSQQFKVPVIGIDVDADWLHVIVPSALLFVWLRFGVTFDNAIRERILLWRLSGYVNCHSTLAQYTMANALNKPGFLDEWFIQYRPNFESYHVQEDLRPYRHLVLVLIYGVAMALSHAAVFATSLIGSERYWQRRIVSKACPLLAWGAPILILYSHLTFSYAGHNRNRFQFAVAGLTLLFSMAFLWIADNPLAPHGQEAASDQDM